MAFIETNWMLILVFVLSGAMLIWPMLQRLLAPGKDIGTLAATQLVNGQNALLLDVREPAEFSSGHLPKAVNVPLSRLSGSGNELGKYTSRPVVVYCQAGGRSRRATGALAKLGFKEVHNLAGGIQAWKQAGLPVER